MAAARPLNILWITCDELRADAVSTYGNPFTSMPAAERLAREGVQFDRAFCQMPKCVPSRCSMLTGRYPHVDGFRTLMGRASAPPHPEVKDNSMVCLQADTPNLVPDLRARGYRTALIGKNHIVEWNLHKIWFDATASWNWVKPQPGEVPEAMRRAEYGGVLPADFPLHRHPDAVSADELIAFLETPSERPFFALLDTQMPHPFYQDYPTPAAGIPLAAIPTPPCGPLAEAGSVERAIRISKKTDGLSAEERRRVRRAYYTMAEFADRQVARVLDALDRLGLADNTLVVLTSDHGDFAGDHGCYEKWDTALFDCITRVPLLMRLPGVLPAGRRTDALVELVDLLPTTCELAGLPVPTYAQGRSLVALATGATESHRDAVFSQGGVERPLLDRAAPNIGLNGSGYKQQVLLDFPESMLRAKMVRTATHKLIHRISGEHELYDLALDPDELVNRYHDPAYVEVRFALRERLLNFLIESETNLPEVNALYA